MKTALKYIIAHISTVQIRWYIYVFHGKDTDKLSLDDLKEPTDVKKTIKGYDGLLDHDKDAGLYFFTYIKNGKVSIVTVEDESLLEKVIV